MDYFLTYGNLERSEPCRALSPHGQCHPFKLGTELMGALKASRMAGEQQQMKCPLCKDRNATAEAI